MATAERGEAGLQRSLKRRHMTMIALGGVIGAGLFVGSGAVINQTGPAAVLSYLAAGVLIVLVMRMLGEMSVADPEVGSFSEYTRRAIGGWARFRTGWLYWYFWALVLAIEAVAGAEILQRWADLPLWVMALAPMARPTATNPVPVGARGPLVGTYHCYSENLVTNGIASLLGTRRAMSRLHVRIAVSEAAAWTGRRFFGGSYRVIPNGVDLVGGVGLCASATPLRSADGSLRIVFVGQAVERKGLPVLLRAFEALRDHIPATLEVIGADEEEVAPLLLDGAHGVTVLGKCDDEAKHAALQRADVLSAPSLGGESFGMVLTEAFAAGTPVVASDIAGYRDVVRNGVDGILHQRGNATELAEALHELYYEPERRLEMARAARERAERFAWPRVAEEVLQAYEDARAMPAIEGGLRGFGARHGFVPADGKRVAPRRLPRLETDATAAKPAVAAARKIGLIVLAVLGVGLAAMALERIGVHRIVLPLLQSSPAWVVVGLGVMCASMVLRAVSWHAILRAAMPGVRVRLRDAAQGTFVGVLMSATLPARLGEPSRAFIVARRTGRVRERFPVVLGTLVSQTVINIFALIVLGSVMFATVGLFSGREQQLLWWMAAPLVLVAVVVLAPALLRGGDSRSSRIKGWAAQAR